MERRPVSESVREYARGIAGGLLFSLPLLYTMEVWWAGFTTGALQLIAYVLVTFALLLGYNRYAGMRPEATLTDIAIEAVEEMGLGLLLAIAALWVLQRITTGMTWPEVTGKVVMEGMIAAIGVSVGTAQLGVKQPNDQGDEPTGQPREEGQQARDSVSFGGQLILAFCGAVLFAANVAPTEEVVVIATEVSSGQVLAIAALSMLLGAVILYFSNFVGAAELVVSENILDVLTGTVTMYAVSLTASILALWFFGRFDGLAPITCVAESVVLGVASTLGASAGRLLLQ